MADTDVKVGDAEQPAVTTVATELDESGALIKNTGTGGHTDAEDNRSEARSNIGTMTTLPITEFEMDDAKYRLIFGIASASKVVVVGELIFCALMFVITIIFASRLRASGIAGAVIGCIAAIVVNAVITIIFLLGIRRSDPHWLVPYFILKIGAMALCLICIIFFLASASTMTSVGGAIVFAAFLLILQIPFIVLARQVYFYYYEKRRLYKKTLYMGYDYDLEQEHYGHSAAAVHYDEAPSGGLPHKSSIGTGTGTSKGVWL